MPTSHVFMDLFDMISSGPAGGVYGSVYSTSMTAMARCRMHNIWCRPPPCDLDVTGTPCQDFAPNGNRLGTNGPQWPVFLAWVSVILAQQVRVVVHENVPQFLVEALQALVEHQYWVFTLLVDCESLGFRLISRKRRFTVLYHRTRTCVLRSPAWLYEHVVQVLALALSHTAWQISDCFLASAEEVVLEIAKPCFQKSVAVAAAMRDMTLLLSVHEEQRLAVYLQHWAAKFGTPACCCTWAVFNLGDNPGAGFFTWSATSGRIPGLRTQNAKYWVPFLARWLTNKELLACMGLPVYESLALAAGVPQVFVSPGPEARHMLGNMMHVASVGTVMAVALACCKFV